MPRLGARRRALPAGAAGKLARYVAPAIFLLVVTAVALVVRSALRSDGSGTRSTSGTAVRTSPARTSSQVPVVKRYYVIRSGDTLDGIAARFATTVGVLLGLNPGVEPTALIPGHQVRVK